MGEEKAFSAKRIDVAVAPLPSPLCGFAQFARYPAFSCRLGAKRARPASRILGPHVRGAFYETKCQGRRKGVFCETNPLCRDWSVDKALVIQYID